MKKLDTYTPKERAEYNKSYAEQNRETINEKRREKRAKYMRYYRLFRTLKKSLLKKLKNKNP